MEKENPLRKIIFHTCSVDKIMKHFNTTENGITDEEAKQRIDKYGRNELKEEKGRTLFDMLIDQFKDIMIIILLVAAAISGFMGEITDTVIIITVVIINAVLGVIQENKAEKALAALKKMSSPYTQVKRNGVVKEIKAEEVVPGDIVILESGNFIPADIRLTEISSLKIEEAALTGESVPVDKITEKLQEQDLVIGDRKNMAYMGSVVTYGRGTGVVVSTGMDTEVGKIAGYISTKETEPTPLQKKLAEMSKYLTFAIILISIFIFIAGVLGGRNYFDMFLTVVSLAVAAIPEGLPAVVTILLALGVQRMAKKHSIVRKLPAVETLGSTQIICSDKTGTLTQNKMTVKKIYIDNELLDESSININNDSTNILMQVLTLCNDSKLDNNTSNVLGDPTETALVDFALDNGFNKNDMEKKYLRKNEIPFESDRKLMTTINALDDNELRILTKGAPDVLIKKCSNVLVDGEVKPLTEEYINKFKQANSDMATKALRILALAYRNINKMPDKLISDTVEQNLTLVALVGMIDPPREEVKEAVKICRAAGIKPVMITGDHRDTALAIAKDLDIVEDEQEVVTGSELDKIDEKSFENSVQKYSVYARVSPEHKVRIVKAWKKNNKIVAMTGDGVNDAPALKISNIGVGMGITGTDVSKNVSDMVLTDDNFATIVDAVKEGRTIYRNIRKVVQFLLSANMGEIITIFIATMLNWTILLPIHILWINLVTDTFPALALGVEKPERDIMSKKPRESNKSFFSGGFGFNIIYQGILEGGITLVTYYIGLTNFDERTAITMAFVTLGLIQLTHSFNVKAGMKTVAQKGLFSSNIWLLGAIGISALLQIIVIIVPYLNTVFKVELLSPIQWLIVITASFSIIPVVEIVKGIQRMVSKKRG